MKVLLTLSAFSIFTTQADVIRNYSKFMSEWKKLHIYTEPPDKKSNIKDAAFEADF